MMVPWSKPDYLNIKWDHTNYLPTPYKEINHDEFMRLMFSGSYSLEGINFSQCYTPEGGVKMTQISEEYTANKGKPSYSRKPVKFPPIYNTHFYFYPGYAVAIMNVMFDKGYQTLENTPAYNIPFYGDKVPSSNLMVGFRFFKIGCNHQKMRTEDYGNCDHADVCDECGLKIGYNSGD